MYIARQVFARLKIFNIKATELILYNVTRLGNYIIYKILKFHFTYTSSYYYIVSDLLLSCISFNYNIARYIPISSPINLLVTINNFKYSSEALLFYL